MTVSGKLRRLRKIINAALFIRESQCGEIKGYNTAVRRDYIPTGGFTRLSMRRIISYILPIHGIRMAQRDRKMERLKQQGGLNRHPERVRAPWFAGNSGFFDARDLAQVKYEMLRQVRVEGAEKTQAAALFGVSRPTFYEAEAAFAQEGLVGLLPKPRGPKSAHKLTAEVMAYIETRLADDALSGARALARQVRAEFGVRVHPRSIERALARKKKRSVLAQP
jgi:transposase